MFEGGFESVCGGCGCRENKKVSLIKQKLDLLKGSTKVKKLGEKIEIKVVIKR